MPPIIAGIEYVVGYIIGATVALVMIHPIIALVTAVSIGYSLFSKDRGVPSKYGISEITNEISNEGIVPILYGGPIILGGNILWQSDPGTNVKRFLAVCIGEIGSIANVKINNLDIAGLSGCSYTAYLGTSTQSVDSRCAGIVKGIHDVAYIALTFTASDKVSGNPVVSAEVTGRKIQTWNGANWTANALASSKNPAAIIRDYMLLSPVLGGCGLSADFIDDNSFGLFYAYCAEFIDNGSGGTEARYDLDIILDTKRSALDNLLKMLITCNAALIHSQSEYKIVYEKANETAVMAFTEDNIIKGSFVYGYGKVDDTPNRLGIEWISALEAKNPKRTAWAEDELDQEEHGLRELIVESYGIIRQSQASRLAKKLLYDRKLNDVWCQFESDIEAMHCEPFDVVSVTHSRPNWTAALFRIIQIDEAAYGRAKYTCMAYNSSVLDDRHGSTFDDWDYGSPPNPYSPVADVNDIVLEEVGWRNADGTHIAHINVSWTAPTTNLEFLDSYIIELKKESADYFVVGSTPASATEYRINLNLEIDKEYTVRIKTFSKEGIISDGAASGIIRLVGKDTSPTTVSSFIVRKFRDQIVCKWTKVSDVDVRRYEIRKGSDWASGGIIGTDLPCMEIVLRDINVGIDQSYWIKSIDNSGNYSDTATEAVITIDDIPFQNIVESYSEDPVFGGTKTNTEVAAGILKISDTFLTGTYVTAVKDIGYICEIGIMIQTVVSVSESLGWDSDPSRAFDDSPTLRFTGEEIPGATSFRVKTSEDNITWSDWEEWISADYKCRYFQIEMTVTRSSLTTDLGVSELTINADLPDVDEFGDDEVTVAGDGKAITFTKTYHVAPSVNIDILSGDAYVHKFSVAPTTAGFTVKLYKLDGTAVVGTFRYHAHGI